MFSSCSNEIIMIIPGKISPEFVSCNALKSLLYKKNKVNSNCQKTKNHFTTSMILDSYPAAFYEYNLKNINSSFVKEFDLLILKGIDQLLTSKI